jgi:hypothetical protein
MPVLFRALVLLLFATSVGAGGMSQTDCREIYQQWKKAFDDWKRLDLEIQGKWKSQGQRGYKDSLEDVKAVLDDVDVEQAKKDVEEAKEKVDKLRKKLKGIKVAKLRQLIDKFDEMDLGRLEEVFKGTAEGLEKVNKAKGKLVGALEKFIKAVDLIERDGSDPKEVIRGFNDYVNTANDIVGPMVEKMPVVRDFMGFYLKAFDASLKAIGNITTKYVADIRREANSIRFHPKWDELVRRRSELTRIQRKILKDCSEYYGAMRPEGYKNTRIWSKVAIKQMEAEQEARWRAVQAKQRALERALHAKNEWERKQAERIRKARSKCDRLLYRVKLIRDAVRSLDTNIQYLEGRHGIQVSREDPKVSLARNSELRAQAKERNLRRIKEIEDLRKRRDKKKKELPAARAKLWQADCLTHAQDMVDKATVYRDEISNAYHGLASVRGLKAANAFMDDRGKVYACQRHCKKCWEKLSAIQEEMRELSRKLQAWRDKVGPAKVEIRQAEADYKGIFEKTKTHYYKDSQGNIVSSSTKTAPGLEYLGYGHFGPRGKLMTAAKKRLSKAKETLKAIEFAKKGLRRQLKTTLPKLRSQQKECAACQKICLEEQKELLFRYRKFLLAFGNPQEQLLQDSEVFQADWEQVQAQVAKSMEDVKTLLAGKTGAHSTEEPPTPAAPSTPATVPAGDIAGDPAAVPGYTYVGVTQSGEAANTVRVKFSAERGGRPFGAGLGGRGANRTENSGTEGLFGSLGGFGTGREDLLSRRSKAKASGSTVDQGEAAGPSKGGQVLIESRSRWDAVKGVLRRFIAAYVSGNLGGVMRTLSRSFLQDPSVLRNAIQDDFKREANINLDLELLSYRFSRDSVQVEVRWSRTSTDQQSGATSVRTGSSRLLFGRSGGYGLTGWFGATPFGLADTAWTQQAAAGDVNQVNSHAPSGGNPGIDLVPPGGNGVVRSALPVTIVDESTGAGPNYFYLNTSTGTAGSFTGNFVGGAGVCNFLSNCSQPGMDVMLLVDQRFGGDMTIMEGQISGGTGNRTVTNCGAMTNLGDFGNILGGGGASFQRPIAGSRQFVIGVQQPGGTAVLVRLDVSGTVGGPYQVASSWITGADVNHVGTGSGACGP